MGVVISNKMAMKYSEKELERISENIKLIVEEEKFQFNNQKDAWNDLDKKVFYLASFVSLFVGFIIVNNLLDIFLDEIPIIFKLSLFLGLIFLFFAGFSLIKIILPSEFKTGASTKDLLKIVNENKLHNVKFELISIYEKINDHNKQRINGRSEIFKNSMYHVLIGLLLMLISKSYSLLQFLGGK